LDKDEEFSLVIPTDTLNIVMKKENTSRMIIVPTIYGRDWRDDRQNLPLRKYKSHRNDF